MFISDFKRRQQIPLFTYIFRRISIRPFQSFQLPNVKTYPIQSTVKVEQGNCPLIFNDRIIGHFFISATNHTRYERAIATRQNLLNSGNWQSLGGLRFSNWKTMEGSRKIIIRMDTFLIFFSPFVTCYLNKSLCVLALFALLL